MTRLFIFGCAALALSCPALASAADVDPKALSAEDTRTIDKKTKAIQELGPSERSLSERRLPIGLDALFAMTRRRDQSSGSAQLYASPWRPAGWLRGTFWMGGANSALFRWPAMPREFRFGLVAAYRYEPGDASTFFAGNGSQGIRTWANAHDLSVGMALDWQFCGCDSAYGWFARHYLLAGGSLTTAQLETLDDGRTYADTDYYLHAMATLQGGFRFSRLFEVTVGAGYVLTGHSQLRIRQTTVALRPESQLLEEVNRSGALFHGGFGLQF